LEANRRLAARQLRRKPSGAGRKNARSLLPDDRSAAEGATRKTALPLERVDHCRADPASSAFNNRLKLKILPNSNKTDS
jgi:hypothetical protein